MKLEIRTEGIEFVVSREPLPKLDDEGRQKADRETGELLNTTESVAMDDSGAEVIKVTTAGLPKVVKRQAVDVRGQVANPWNVDGRGGVAFRADSRCPRSPPSCSNYVARSTHPGQSGRCSRTRPAGRCGGHCSGPVSGGRRWSGLACSARLVSEGVPVNDVQTAMGHEQASTTLDRYTHRSQGRDSRVRAAFVDFVADPGPTKAGGAGPAGGRGGPVKMPFPLVAGGGVTSNIVRAGL